MKLFQNINNELWLVRFEGDGSAPPFEIEQVTTGIHPHGYAYAIAEAADGRQHDITAEQAQAFIKAGVARTIGKEEEFSPDANGVLRIK